MNENFLKNEARNSAAWEENMIRQGTTQKETKKEKDIRPNYYVKGGLECRIVQAAATCNLTGQDATETANAIKYLWRWKDKNGVEDLLKARTNIDFMIARNSHVIGENVAPCPNCGELEHTFIEYDGSGNCSVTCLRCGYIGPIGSSNSDAVKKWNEEEATD